MSAPKVYIDGKEGTTGLQIYDRLGSRGDIELLLIDRRSGRTPPSGRNSSTKPIWSSSACPTGRRWRRCPSLRMRIPGSSTAPPPTG